MSESKKLFRVAHFVEMTGYDYVYANSAEEVEDMTDSLGIDATDVVDDYYEIEEVEARE